MLRGSRRRGGSGRRPRPESGRARTRTRLAPDRRAPGRTDQLLPRELVQELPNVGLDGRPSRQRAAQNTFPTTAASCSSAFRSGGSVSRRAAMRAWTLSGTVTASPRRAPTRAAPDRIPGRSASGRTPPRTAGSRRRLEQGGLGLGREDRLRPAGRDQLAVSPGVSGGSDRPCGCACPHPTRADVRRAPAGRRTATSIGTPLAQSMRCSMNASNASPPSAGPRTPGRADGRRRSRRGSAARRRTILAPAPRGFVAQPDQRGQPGPDPVPLSVVLRRPSRCLRELAGGLVGRSFSRIRRAA